MKIWKFFIAPVCLLMFIVGYQNADAQENLAQQAYAIFQQNCLNCHGASGPYKEELLIDRTALIDTKVVIPGDPENSEFYKRLLGPTENGPQMPLNLPSLSPEAVETIARWITVGAPDWDVQHDINFITTDTILDTIQTHLESLDPFDRPSARYFTMTHLYNAGESPETLSDYGIALSKLVNSLSWKFEITNPTPIDEAQTIFYIDLRRYEWNDIRTNVWAQIEQVYPYNIAFDPETQAGLLDKLTQLQTETGSTVPFVHVDWFLATASLPPLYHDILDLPQTDRVLEAQLEVNVAGNIRNAPGVDVWRAGFNDSGVSSNNRVVERHASRYGAYWKSYDFAGSVGSQNIFTHPLDFTHDGGEIVFNLPNGLQAYLLVDANGDRLEDAPIDIVSNPAASDPTVRNGLSCIGCHTQGMKKFEDSVRAAIEQDQNPPYDKIQALRLYPEQSILDDLVQKDTIRFQQALEKIGGPFADDASRQRFFKKLENEPIQRFHELFQAPLGASHAAAAVGLETVEFLAQVREKQSLKNLGLQTLTDENGTVKRDAWTSNFDDVIFALNTPDSVLPPVVQRPELIPGESVDIPDVNLRAAIEAEFNKAPGDIITAAEMATLERLELNNKDISDLTGLEFAINLNWLNLSDNNISDLSPITGLFRLSELRFHRNPVLDLSPLEGLKNLTGLWFEENRQVSDVSPLAGLINLEKLEFSTTLVSDLSPLKGLTNLTSLWVHFTQVSDLSIFIGLVNLKEFGMWGSPVSDLSPLTGLTKLEYINICGGHISDLKPLVRLPVLRKLALVNNEISDISPLAALTGLQHLKLSTNNISDLSPLANLTELTFLEIQQIMVSDISPLANLTKMRNLFLSQNMISDISPLAGLTDLRELDLIDNPISDFSPIDELFRNPEARIFTTEVNFTDPNLRAAIEAELGKAAGDTITAVEMATFERLNLNSKGINDLTGLEFAVNLNWLAINDNNISDLSPIAGLIRLTELRFNYNLVSDLSPLKGLKNLTGLWFTHNFQVSDLSPLAELVNLETISFVSEHVTDLSPLSGLKNLTVLWPQWARISDLSPLAELTNLKEFVMWGNPSAIDLSPFAGLTKMEKFDICGAEISDLSPLANLTGLKLLNLVGNKITDISSLSALTELERMDIRWNKITDVSPLAGLTNLRYLRVSQNEISDISPLDGIRENMTLVWFDNPGFPEGGPKIEGPWLWAVLPDARPNSDADLLSEASGGMVTEIGIATHGATEGKSIGSSVWTSHILPPSGEVKDLLDFPLQGESEGTVYGYVSLDSPLEQETTMFVGISYHNLKVWLNGKLIRSYKGHGDIRDAYTDFTPVTLQKGRNILLIAFRHGSRAFVGFEPGTDYGVAIPSVDYVFSKTPIYAGETFTLDVNAKDVYDMAGWQFNIAYDPAVLEAVDVSEGDFLKSAGGTTFFQEGTIDNAAGKITGLSATSFNKDGVTGTGTLLSVTFLAKTDGETRLALSNFQFGSITGEILNAGPHEVFITIGSSFIVGDVNRDGQVSVLDMILVARYFGEDASANPQADVNRDGIVNILDLILVAQHLGESAASAAPTIIAINNGELTPAMIQAWIAEARIENDGSIAFQKGIANLERLLALFIPEKTTLLHNYPNPFNPETWIPYHLANSSDVTITIYDMHGTVVRQLNLGHQQEGYYTSKVRAAYWDGRNAVGERVASGIYFYQLQADDVSFLRKMVILK